LIIWKIYPTYKGKLIFLVACLSSKKLSPSQLDQSFDLKTSFKDIISVSLLHLGLKPRGG